MFLADTLSRAFLLKIKKKDLELEVSVDQLAVTPEEYDQFKSIHQALLKKDGQKTKKKYHKMSNYIGNLEMKFPASMAFCTRTTSWLY